MDFSYGTSSAAYTHSEWGLPVGNLNVFPSKLAEWQTLSTEKDDATFTPNEFKLAQGYPNHLTQQLISALQWIKHLT